MKVKDDGYAVELANELARYKIKLEDIIKQRDAALACLREIVVHGERAVDSGLLPGYINKAKVLLAAHDAKEKQ